MSEVEKIKERYEWRKKFLLSPSKREQLLNKNIISEREKIYSLILHEKFEDLSSLKIMEIGAGTGSNLSFFKNAGIKDKNIYANELLEDRIEGLRSNHPSINIFPGNALDLNFKNEFDIVFQSTVFTSILDLSFRQQLAEKMREMTKSGGIILWYDFTFSNPFQSYIKPVTKKDVRLLFCHNNKVKFYNVTLYPPIGKRTYGMYNLVNSIFPFLRSHIIAVISKDN